MRGLLSPRVKSRFDPHVQPKPPALASRAARGTSRIQPPDAPADQAVAFLDRGRVCKTKRLEQVSETLEHRAVSELLAVPEQPCPRHASVSRISFPRLRGMPQPAAQQWVVQAVNQRPLTIRNRNRRSFAPHLASPKQSRAWTMTELELRRSYLAFPCRYSARRDEYRRGEDLVRQVPVMEGRPSADISGRQRRVRYGPR